MEGRNNIQCSGNNGVRYEIDKMLAAGFFENEDTVVGRAVKLRLRRTFPDGKSAGLLLGPFHGGGG